MRKRKLMNEFLESLKIGMDDFEVNAKGFSAGVTFKKNVTKNQYGTSEQWVVNNPPGGGSFYIYFKNGELTSIQDYRKYKN